MSSQLLSANHFNTVEVNILNKLDNFYSQDINETMKQIRLISIRSYFTQYERHFNTDYLGSIKSAKIELNKITNTKILNLLGLYNAMRSILYQIELRNEELTSIELKAMNDFNSYLASISYKIISPIIKDNVSKSTWSID